MLHWLFDQFTIMKVIVYLLVAWFYVWHQDK